MKNIDENFLVTEEEYLKLEEKFGKLAEFQAWEMIRKNSKNNHTDDQEDISQELRISLIKAGAYYKRQVYIEKCLELCGKYVSKNNLELIKVIKKLQYLWDNKTRHGANRQKFGPNEEVLLDKIIKEIVPKDILPSKSEKLKFDAKFSTYCKSITWNRCKALGKKITREKTIRSGTVSISEYDYLGSS